MSLITLLLTRSLETSRACVNSGSIVCVKRSGVSGRPLAELRFKGSERLIPRPKFIPLERE